MLAQATYHILQAVSSHAVTRQWLASALPESTPEDHGQVGDLEQSLWSSNRVQDEIAQLFHYSDATN
jgi:hypothetical protein